MDKYHSIEFVSEDIIYLTFKKSSPSREQFQAYLDDFETVVRNYPGRAHIFDGSNSGWLPSELQLMQAQWMKRHDNLLATHGVYTAYIVPTTLSRMLLTAIFSVQRPPIPYVIVKSYEEAMAKLEMKLNLKETG